MLSVEWGRGDGERISLMEKAQAEILTKTHSIHILNALDNCHEINWSLTNRQSLRCHFRISIMRLLNYGEKAFQMVLLRCFFCCCSTYAAFNGAAALLFFKYLTLQCESEQAIVCCVNETQKRWLYSIWHRTKTRTNLLQHLKTANSSSSVVSMMAAHSYWKREFHFNGSVADSDKRKVESSTIYNRMKIIDGCNRRLTHIRKQTLCIWHLRCGSKWVGLEFGVWIKSGAIVCSRTCHLKAQ